MASALLGHRSLHEQGHEHERKRQNGKHPKAVEVGERGCLLLPQIFKFLQSELPRCDRIGDLLGEERLGVRDEGVRGRVEGIEVFAETDPRHFFTRLQLIDRNPGTPRLSMPRPRNYPRCRVGRH